jgi:hypothetical protein
MRSAGLRPTLVERHGRFVMLVGLTESNRADVAPPRRAFWTLFGARAASADRRYSSTR